MNETIAGLLAQVLRAVGFVGIVVFLFRFFLEFGTIGMGRAWVSGLGTLASLAAVYGGNRLKQAYGPDTEMNITGPTGDRTAYSDWRLWLSPVGRVNRRPFFFTGLAAGAIMESRKLVPAGSGLILPILLLALLATYSVIALGIKRCHDREKTGWFMLLNLVPIVCLWPMIELTFFKGTTGPNEYGLDPLQSPESQADAQAALADQQF